MPEEPCVCTHKHMCDPCTNAYHAGLEENIW